MFIWLFVLILPFFLPSRLPLPLPLPVIHERYSIITPADTSRRTAQEKFTVEYWQLPSATNSTKGDIAFAIKTYNGRYLKIDRANSILSSDVLSPLAFMIPSLDDVDDGSDNKQYLEEYLFRFHTRRHSSVQHITKRASPLMQSYTFKQVFWIFQLFSFLSISRFYSILFSDSCFDRIPESYRMRYLLNW